MANSHLSEEWRPVEGYDGYEASSEGRVRSWRPTGPNRPRPEHPKILTPRKASGGGIVVKAAKTGRAQASVTVGRLVAIAFHGVPAKGSEHVHRRNGDITDSRAKNLFWGPRLILRKCAAPGCDEYANGRLRGAGDYCSRHYQRQRAHGEATGGRVSPGTLLDWLDRHAAHDGDECLHWPFARQASGYGRISFEGRVRGAHAIMCEMAHGAPNSDGDEVAHECGNPSCVNPRHLRWDTRSGNHMDKHRHGTMPLGEAVHGSKLTERDVRWIRANKGRITYARMAERFGMHVQSIYSVASGKTWAWVK